MPALDDAFSELRQLPMPSVSGPQARARGRRRHRQHLAIAAAALSTTAVVAAAGVVGVTDRSEERLATTPTATAGPTPPGCTTPAPDAARDFPTDEPVVVGGLDSTTGRTWTLCLSTNPATGRAVSYAVSWGDGTKDQNDLPGECGSPETGDDGIPAPLRLTHTYARNGEYDYRATLVVGACEGQPRSLTSKGTLFVNTDPSRPGIVDKATLPRVDASSPSADPSMGRPSDACFDALQAANRKDVELLSGLLDQVDPAPNAEQKAEVLRILEDPQADFADPRHPAPGLTASDAFVQAARAREESLVKVREC